MEYETRDLDPYVFGLPWFGTGNHELFRLPRDVFPALHPDVAHLATNPAGARVRFTATTGGLGIEMKVGPSRAYEKFSRAGQCGIDLYVDGSYYHTFIPARDGYNIAWVEIAGAEGEHEFCLYLPTYTPVEITSIGVDGTITPARPYSIKKPIVFYGSSITQGAYASRPGLAYPSLLGRALDADIVNLGFSGNGKGQPPVLDLVNRIDASCFVMDWGANLSSPGEPALLEERYGPFLATVQRDHPGTPVVIVVPQWVDPTPWDASFRARWDDIREHIASVARRELASGNELIACVDGYDIIGPGDMDCTADGTHATDLGFHRYRAVLEPVLRGVLARAGHGIR